MILLGPMSPLCPRSPWPALVKSVGSDVSIESYFPTNIMEPQGFMEPLGSVEPPGFVVYGAPLSVSRLGQRSPQDLRNPSGQINPLSSTQQGLKTIFCTL